MSKQRSDASGNPKRKGSSFEALEPRILMSATWIDPATGEEIAAPSENNDEFRGGDGDDIADALGGDDLLQGGAGDDILRGGEGNDTLSGGADDDVLRGGTGTDTADYSSASAGVTVDITAVGVAQDTGGAGTDTLYAIEGVRGSAHDDVFAFTDPIPGQNYSVDGGGGSNALDLSAWDASAIEVDALAQRITVDLGSSQSFTIDYNSIAVIQSADATSPDFPSATSLDAEEGAPFTLTSTQIGGSTSGLSWSWSQTAGDAVVLSDANAAHPTIEIPEGFVNTSMQFRVDVTDGATTWTQFVTVDISGDNDPVVITASDQSVQELDDVTLDASIVDPEGQDMLFTWTQVSGTSVTLSGTDTLSPTFQAPELLADEDLVFRIEATDGTSTTSKLITVSVSADNDAPVANAGSDTSIEEDTREIDSFGGETLTAIRHQLSASGVDPENQALSYFWEQLSGPTVVFDDAGLAAPSFDVPQGLANYDMQFRVTVSDGVNSSTDVVTVTVNADNDRPLIERIDTPPHTETTTTGLSVTATDPEGQGLTYLWTQTAGPAVTIADPTSAATSFTSPDIVAGENVQFRVDVSDGVTTSSRVVTVFVDADNDAPTVDAGDDQRELEGVRIDLSASAQDPEGKALAYNWTQISGPTAPMAGSASATPTIITPDVSTTTDLVFQVSTTDGRNTVTDTVTITVDPRTGGGGGGFEWPSFPIDVDIEPSLQSVEETEGATIGVDVSSFDGPGPVTYSWTQIGGASVTLHDADTADASFTAPEVLENEILQFEVEVHDGENTRVEVVSVIVTADNDPPTPEAGPAQSVQENDTVQLAASASDPEGRHLTGFWRQVSGPSVQLSHVGDPNASFEAPDLLTTQDVVLEWVVSDGVHEVADQVTITIEADNDAPIIDAGANSTVQEGASFTLNPSATDPEGQPLSYEWVQTGGPSVTLDDPNAKRPSFSTENILANEEITFELRVSDGVHTVTDSVTITIEADNDGPIVDAGPFQSVEEGDSVTLNPTASDPENQPLTYSWTQVSGPSVSLSDPALASPQFTAPEGLANTYVTFEVEVSDGTNTATDRVTILIGADNDAPINDAGPAQTVAEETTVTLAGTATEPEGQTLSHQWVQVSGPPVTLSNPSALNPSFESPNLLDNADLVFELRSSDGTNTIADTVTITVLGENDAPDATATTSTGSEDADVTIKLRGTDPDFDDAVEEFRITSLPANGALEHNGVAVHVGDVIPKVAIDGNLLRFVPDADWSGTVSFGFEAGDGEAFSSAVQQSIRVVAVADEPAITASNTSGVEDTEIPLQVATQTTDTDGSETISFFGVSGAPLGSVFSDGSNSATFGGSDIDMTLWDLSKLTITPPLHHDLDFDITYKSIAREPSSGDTEEHSVSARVAITPVNDAPFPNDISTTTAEDTPTSITLTATEVDTGDAIEQFRIDSLPTNGTLRVGTTTLGIGSTISASQVANGDLVFVPADDVHGSSSFTFSAFDGELWSTDTGSVQVNVTADADAPSLTVPANVTTNEDSPVAIPIATSVADTDGSEKISSVLIEGLPVGATITDGVRSFTASGASTSIDVTAWSLDQLTVQPPEHVDTDFELTVTSTAEEGSNADTAQTTDKIQVAVVAVADAPQLPGGSASVVEDNAVSLGLGAVFPDTDGSEAHSLQLADIPVGATITDGVHSFTASAGNSSVDVGTWDLSAVTITPPSNSDVDFTLRLVATATENANSDSASASGTIDIAIQADADAPQLTVQAASGNEDEAISLSIQASLVDTDNSESLRTVVSNIPVGATLSDGVHDFTAGNSTSVDISAWNASALTITAPEDSGDDFTLVVSATSTEANGGDTATTIQNLPVTVVAVADAPDVSSVDGSGSEDLPIAFSIDSALTDTDGSESLSVSLTTIPVGATLSDGVRSFTASNGNTSIDVTSWDWDKLSVQAPQHSDADFTIGIVATSTESEGDKATQTGSVAITVAATPDAPTLATSDASGVEDQAAALSITPALVDTDGSESLTVRIDSIPIGATISDGTNSFTASAGNTSADITGWSVSGLTVTAPEHSSAPFTLDVVATSTEASNTRSASTNATIDVTWTAEADAPSLATAPAAGDEDSPIALDLTANLVDTDASESLQVEVQSIPVGATLSDGVHSFTASSGNTSVDVSAWSWDSLEITPPSHSDADFVLDVVATATEASNNDTASTSSQIPVTVTAVADAPTLSTTDGVGAEDTAIAFSIDADLVDTDGSEALQTTIGSIPAGATLSDGVNSFVASASNTSVDVTNWNLNALTVLPATNEDRDFTLSVIARASETQGDTAESHGTVEIKIAAVPDAPSLAIQDASGDEDSPIPLSITPSLTDNDDSESLSLELQNLPVGATLSDGVHSFTASAGSTSVDVTTWDWNELAVTPPAHSDEDFALRVVATATEESGLLQASTTEDLTVRVDAIVDAPQIDVFTELQVLPNRAQDFPISVSTPDIDGSEEIRIRIFDLPEDAVLSSGTREADGTWTLRPADLPELTIETPPAGVFDIRVVVTNDDRGDTVTSELTATIRTLEFAPLQEAAPLPEDDTAEEEHGAATGPVLERNFEIGAPVYLEEGTSTAPLRGSFVKDGFESIDFAETKTVSRAAASYEDPHSKVEEQKATSKASLMHVEADATQAPQPQTSDEDFRVVEVVTDEAESQDTERTPASTDDAKADDKEDLTLGQRILRGLFAWIRR